MSKWPMVALGEVCEITSGSTPKTSEPRFWDGQIAWATPKDLTGLAEMHIASTGRSITTEGLAACGANVLPVGSVLLSSRAPIGHIAINTVPMATNQGFKSLVPDSTTLNARYLARWLKANVEYLKSLGNGATFKEISKSVVERVTIPLPPLDEQRRIADILDRADVLRAQRRQTIEQLDELIQSIFVDMFGTLDLSKTLRSEHTTTIGTVAEIQGGLTVNSGRSENPLEVNYLRVANVHRGRIDLTEIKRLRVTESEVSRTKLFPGDILIVEGHGNPAEIGRAARWVASEALHVHQNHLIRARFAQTLVEPIYAEAYLNSMPGRRHLLSRARTTSGLNTINISDVRGCPIPVPPIDQQRRFVRFVDAATSSAAVIESARVELDSLFASLQSRAFNGEL